MDLLKLIEDYRSKLKTNPNNYSYLLFALQIPSICGRINFPQTSENTGKAIDGKLYKKDGTPWDSNIYKAWLRQHYDLFIDIYGNNISIDEFCDNIYNLRCQMTHEGILMSDKNKLYFVDSNYGLYIDNIAFIPIKRLCGDMFDAAYRMLFNMHVSINITLFDDMLISPDIYSKIQNDSESLYDRFWKDYSEDDHMLYCIFTHIILNREYKKQEIDAFFSNQPNNIYEIWDFGYKYGYVIDMDETFIHKDYDESKSSICRNLKEKTDVLRLTKSQYERMLIVAENLDSYSKKHPFDIFKYIS